MKRLFLSGLLLSLLLSPVSRAGTWGERGISKRFLTGGNFLYAADGRGVTVYDVSDLTSMHEVDVESLDDESFDLARMGAGDLVLATHGGLERFSIGENGALLRKGNWRNEGGVTHVAANEKWVAASRGQSLFLLEPKGDGLEASRMLTLGHEILDMVFTPTHLFVTVDTEAIYAIDPSTGAVSATLTIPSQALALSGSTLWSASSIGGLVAIDVSSAIAPRVLSTTALGTIRMDGVAASGTRVFVFEKPRTIRFFDATDVRAPQLAATRSEWISVMGASGTNLFFSGQRLDRDAFPYETGLPVRAFDATTPVSPRLAGEVHTFAGPVSGTWTDGSLAYVIDPPFFRVLDVSKTSDPREITSIELPETAPQLRVRVKNGIALVYGRDFVHLIDVTDPIRPRLRTTWNPRGHSPDDAALMADGLFVEVNEHSGIHVVDYAQYDPPAQVGGRIMHWHDVAAGDDAFYVLAGGAFLTMSVTDRAKAQDVELIRQNAHGMDTVPPNADRPSYVVLREGMGIRSYSLREDRFHPREIGFASATAPGVIATNESSVVFDIDGFLHRIDLVNPARVEATEMRVTSVMQMSMVGEKIVVADRYRVRVYGPDTPPPPSPATSKKRSVRP